MNFEEKRHFVDDNRISRRGELADFLLGAGAHARMDDRFELFSRGGIIEDDRAEFLPVEGLIRLQNLPTEGGNDVMPGRLAGLDDFSCKNVGIDDRRAKSLENVCDGSLARGDAAG